MECRYERLARTLTEFEAFCWNWYWGNVNAFTWEAGLVGDYVRELKMDKTIKKMFLKAMNMIYTTIKAIIRDEAEREAREGIKK